MNSILTRVAIGVLVVIAVIGFLFSIGSYGGIIPFIGFVVTPILLIVVIIQKEKVSFRHKEVK